MASRLQIPTIEPAFVVHKLALKPVGTYIIRAKSENDDIISGMKFQPDTNSSPYVVLSVRVNETQYKYPIMNYRLPLMEPQDEDDLRYLLQQYESGENADKLPILTERCAESDDIDWRFEQDGFEEQNIADVNKNKRCTLQAENYKIKIFKKLIKNNRQSFENEFSILKNLCYFHIISFYGIYTAPDNDRYFVFADNGKSLESKRPFTIDQFLKKHLSIIGYQIACGMIYLGSKHIIHRDLHAGNILIDHNNFVRIADFGHAIVQDDIYQERLRNSERNFLTRRLAPECLSPLMESNGITDIENLLRNFSVNSDVWACGLVFIELVLQTNEHLYPYLVMNEDDTEEYQQLVKNINTDKEIHEQPSGYPDDFYNVLKCCWAYYPEGRISFLDLRNEMWRLFQSEDNSTNNESTTRPHTSALFFDNLEAN